MGIVNYALKGNIKNFNKKLDRISEKTGISKIKLQSKFLSCFRLIGTGYSDFLNYELYNKTKEDILEYASINNVGTSYFNGREVCP